ncbi:MAG TPA: NUDIX domain-containing protein [Rhizomicrobium sp.]|nr:NUDIX domain-containing protein [Rhizomicrobium sp.]
MAIKALLAPVAFGAHAMVFDTGGKVLLARHSYKSGWSFPGGGVNRGEPAEKAIMRELREEIGAVQSDPPIFYGLFTRPAGWATNVVALYSLMNAQVEFRPNFEVREIVFADPANPPPNTSAGTRRRLAEIVGKTPPSIYW